MARGPQRERKALARLECQLCPGRDQALSRDTSASRPLRPGASAEPQSGPRPTRPRPGRAAGTAAGGGCASWAAAPRSLREVRAGRLARGGNGATRAKLAVPAGTRPSPAWAAAAPPAAGSAPASPSSGARGLSPTSPSTGGRTAAGAGRGGGARGLFKGTERRTRAPARTRRQVGAGEGSIQGTGERSRELLRHAFRALTVGASTRHRRGWDQRLDWGRTWRTEPQPLNSPRPRLHPPALDGKSRDRAALE